MDLTNEILRAWMPTVTAMGGTIIALVSLLKWFQRRDDASREREKQTALQHENTRVQFLQALDLQIKTHRNCLETQAVHQRDALHSIVSEFKTQGKAAEDRSEAAEIRSIKRHEHLINKIDELNKQPVRKR